MKILIVDDSQTMRNIIKRVLVDTMGIPAENIGEASDGIEAYSLIQNERFDLYTVDWNMPNMDGLQFLKKVRAGGDTTPIIMVTTEAERARVVTAITAGANNYVVKPMSAETIQQKIEETLAKCAST